MITAVTISIERSTIRISITRLKQVLNAALRWINLDLDYEIEWSINDKNLDYEIETCRRLAGIRAINDKNLDYEIETSSHCGVRRGIIRRRSTIRISITRLKHE